MSAYCRSCGTQNDASFRFCTSCGQELAQPAGGQADQTLVVRSPNASPTARPEHAQQVEEQGEDAQPEGAGAPPPRSEVSGDATLVIRPLPPASGRPGASAAPGIRPRAPAPGGATGAPTVQQRLEQPPQTRSVAVSAHEPVSGWTTVAAAETVLLLRPTPLAGRVALLSRGTEVGVIRYQGPYAAVRLQSGTGGFLPRRLLAAFPPAPELPVSKEMFALQPNIARVRGQASLREGPSRLAKPIRDLAVGEPVQLQTFEAYFARVRTADGAEGFVERGLLNRQVGATAEVDVGTLLFAFAAMLAFVGSLLPWAKDCGQCPAELGWSLATGKLTLLLALAGSATLFARFRYTTVPLVRFFAAMTGTGSLIAFLAFIKLATDGDVRTEAGAYITMFAGLVMAAAPWLDRLRGLVVRGL